MFVRGVSRFGIGVIALAAAGTAMAFAPDSAEKDKGTSAFIAYPVTIGQQVLRPNTVDAKALTTKAVTFEGNAFATESPTVRYDSISGTPRVIRGMLSSSDQKLAGQELEAFDQAARAFFSAHKSLGLAAVELRLDSDATLFNEQEQMLKYRVYRDGILVADAAVDAHFKLGNLVQVINHSFAEALAADLSKSLSGLDNRVAAVMQADRIESRGDQLRVRASTSGYVLLAVEEFEVENAQDTFLVQVDKVSGKIFEIRRTKHYLDGSAEGHVHARYYADALELRPYGELELSYSGGTVATDVTGNFYDAPEASEPTLNGFKGARVNVRPTSGSSVTQTGTMIRDGWRVVYRKTDATDAASDKNVAQSMIYYHANQIIHEAKGHIQPNWLDQRLTANSSLNQTCNAHWDGSTINFYSGGGGCANTGLISDVVYHEWGHGLDANTGGIEDGAYSEGFGDIMSMIMTRSPTLGIGFRIGGGSVRELEPNKIYPADTGGGVHAEGQIIGSTFWDLYKGLVEAHGEDQAGAIIKNYAFKMIYPAARYTEVYDALLVIDDDDGDLTNGTPNYCTLNKNFSDHGLAEADQACSLAVIDEFQIRDDSGNANGFIEPGETVDLKLLARNAAPSALAGLLGTVSVTDASFVTVTDESMSWDNIGAGETAVSRDSATFAVDASAECGTSFNVAVRLEADSRIATSTRRLTLGRLDGEVETLVAAGLPVAIVDSETVSAAVTFAGEQWEGGTGIQGAHLRFAITHTYVGDLDVVLRAPSGATYSVYSGTGSADDVNFDQDITALVATETGSGDWTLEVSDTANQDEGSLNAFSLELIPAKYICE